MTQHPQAKTPVNYVEKIDLVDALNTSRAIGHMNDALARIFQLMCFRMSQKKNFINYSYNEDMQSFAMLTLVMRWKSFNPIKSNEPFSYFTQVIYFAYLEFIKKEKKMAEIPDKWLMSQGKGGKQDANFTKNQSTGGNDLGGEIG